MNSKNHKRKNYTRTLLSIIITLSLFAPTFSTSTATATATATSTPTSTNYQRQLRAAQIADSMNVNLLAAQVILGAVPGKENVPETTRRLLTDYPVGGVLLFGYNLAQDAEKNRAFVDSLFSFISNLTLPPFIASDQEGGTVQRIRGDAALPAPLTYWESDKNISRVESDAARAGRELRRIGVTLNLAPLAEVLTETNRQFLTTRSYGPDATFTTNAAAAFIRGMNTAGIASTLKHFPGNSAADPHYHEAIMDVCDSTLAAKIAPFAELVRRENPASIMVSHVVVRAWDDKALTRSPVAVQHLRDMGFEGIIMADDFAMVAAGAAPETAVVEALVAGVDMIMAWPRDMPNIHRAIVRAVRNGTLSEERLRDAVARIVYQKLRYNVVR